MSKMLPSLRRLGRSPMLRVVAILAMMWAGGIFTRAGEIQDLAGNGDLKKIKALVRKEPTLVTNLDDNGATALAAAAANGHLDVMEFLLKKKVEVNTRDNDGMTPLHAAASGGSAEAVALLLANQAEANATNDAGRTP